MMIEPLLEAERAFDMGLLDQAERLFRGVADADPRNSIAVVGLSRVALERGDDEGALTLARRAAEIDPANPMAARMVARLEEVLAARAAGAERSVAAAAAEGLPAAAEVSAAAAAAAGSLPAPEGSAATTAAPAAEAAPAGQAPTLGRASAAGPAPAARPASEIEPASAAESAPTAEAALADALPPSLGPAPAAQSASAAAEPSSGAHRRRNRSLLERLLRRP